MQKRKNDYLEGQFKDWPFMSVHFWGEKPPGIWKLQVENTGSLLNRGTNNKKRCISMVTPHRRCVVLFRVQFLLCSLSGKLLKWQLIIYGVAEEPVRLKHTEPRPLKPVHAENNTPESDVRTNRF